MRIPYELVIEAPDEIDPVYLDAINEDADEQDDTIEKKVRRWIGGDLSETEVVLSEMLPDGWRARISEAAA